MTEAPQPGTASQDFEKQLALVTLPAQGSLKDKEKETPPWSGWPGSQVQVSNQVETLSFVLVFMIFIMIVTLFFCIEGQILIIYEALFFGPNNICQYYCFT